MSRIKQRTDDFPTELLTGDEAIDIVIDAVMLGSKPLQKLTKKVLHAQKKLRKAVDDDTWKAYLALEAIVNERASTEAELLVRWALGHGSRSRR